MRCFLKLYSFTITLNQSIEFKVIRRLGCCPGGVYSLVSVLRIFKNKMTPLEVMLFLAYSVKKPNSLVITQKFYTSDKSLCQLFFSLNVGGEIKTIMYQNCTSIDQTLLTDPLNFLF